MAAFVANDPLGTDLSLWPDLDAGGALVSGQTCLAQAVLRRLTTRRGGLFYDPNYGTDIRDFVSETLGVADSTAAIQRAIEAEATKDERVLDASAAVVFNPQSGSLTCHLTLQTSPGPFTFVLSISSVTVTLLRAG